MKGIVDCLALDASDVIESALLLTDIAGANGYKLPFHNTPLVFLDGSEASLLIAQGQDGKRCSLLRKVVCKICRQYKV